MQANQFERARRASGRELLFWTGCAAIIAGVLLHLPMLAMAHKMGDHLIGMPMGISMYVGIGLIILGIGPTLGCLLALDTAVG